MEERLVQEENFTRGLEEKLHQLRDLLYSENTILQHNDAARVEEITNRKEDLLREINLLLTSVNVTIPGNSKLAQIIQECERQNIVNGCIIHLGLRLNEQLLQILTGKESLPIYSSSGLFDNDGTSNRYLAV